jgi:hypothetical protein
MTMVRLPGETLEPCIRRVNRLAEGVGMVGVDDEWIRMMLPGAGTSDLPDSGKAG